MNHSISMEPHKDTTTQNELPDVEVFRKVFKHYSQQAQQLNPSLNLHVPDEILREDIIPCLKSALNQPIDLAPRYILNCFAIDTSAKITWKEFQLSLERMNLVKKQQGKGGVTTRSHSKLMDARKRGRVLGPQPQLVHETPLTTSQEVGWIHGSAPMMPKLPSSSASSHNDVENNIEPHAPIKGTDVTRGGEGRSLSTYYGAHLGRTF